MNIDMNKVEQFAGQVLGDISATFSGVMTNIGHKLGLCKAMAGAGAMTSKMLADKTDTHERYVREWLNNQTAGGYVRYDADSNSYTLPDEHIPVLVDDESPVFLVPALDVASSLWMDEDKVADVFRCGEGTPCSLSQEVGLALGAQAGEKHLSEVLQDAGFNNVRRAAETPFNIVLEIRNN